MNDEEIIEKIRGLMTTYADLRREVDAEGLAVARRELPDSWHLVSWPAGWATSERGHKLRKKETATWRTICLWRRRLEYGKVGQV